MSETPPPDRPRRGRPRTFNKDEALRSILNVFWKKGFAATSLDDLSAATGLSRPSLYAAYGGKSDMYLSALAAFGSQMEAAAFPSLANGKTLHASLSGFYTGAINIYFNAGKTSLGCLVFTTAIADAAGNNQIKKAVHGFVESMDEALTACIKGHAPAMKAYDIRPLAQLAGGMLINIATRARAGAKRTDLEDLAATSATLIADAVPKSG